MTFVVNVLHKNMSIIATDQKAVARSQHTSMPNIGNETKGITIVDDYNKITRNSGARLALGIAGNTHDHYYTPEIELCPSVDEVLVKIRKHMDNFLCIHDRKRLSTLSRFMANQGIASFFDQEVGTFFTYTYLFSPIETQNRLHRAAKGIKILHAGSGSEYFQRELGEEVEKFTASANESCTVEACVIWLKEVFRKISAIDPDTGPEALFVMANTADSRFRFITGG